MAMDAAEAPRTGRLAELERENAELREQLRRYSATQKVAQGAIAQATQEREVAQKIAHQVVVEEQATRAAVEVQNSNTSFAAIMQIVNLFVLVILLIGLFFWLPREVYSQSRLAAPTSTTITVPATGGSTIIPAPAR